MYRTNFVFAYSSIYMNEMAQESVYSSRKFARNFVEECNEIRSCVFSERI